MEIISTVLVRGEPQFNCVGQRLPSGLHDTDQTIGAGLTKRLAAFALRRLTDAGFDVEGWVCEVYTMDADERPADRFYTVEFANQKGGRIGVQGILTQRGWPVVDHGLCIADTHE